MLPVSSRDQSSPLFLHPWSLDLSASSLVAAARASSTVMAQPRTSSAPSRKLRVDMAASHRQKEIKTRRQENSARENKTTGAGSWQIKQGRAAGQEARDPGDPKLHAHWLSLYTAQFEANLALWSVLPRTETSKIRSASSPVSPFRG